MLNGEAVSHLREECLGALSSFIDEAKKMCEMFGTFEDSSLSFGDRLKIFEQRTAEYEAYERYRIARSALFRMANNPNSHSATNCAPDMRVLRGRRRRRFQALR